METKKELREEIKDLMNLHDYIKRQYPGVFNTWYSQYYNNNK